MKFLPVIFLTMLLASFTSFAADTEKDTRVFELRTYYAAPGKLDNLHARFRDHTTKRFEKHGMTNIGYWVPIENPDNKLVYLLAFPDRAARDTAWKAFKEDEEWKKVAAASEADGKLVTKVESVLMTATDFSAAVQPGKGNTDRVFELRTYDTTPGNLPLLHARFRDHTRKLFARYGMTNLFYFQLLPDQPGAENTLIYFLAHASEQSGKGAFTAFRADPEWIAAKAASEEKGGGSLTVPDGVQSVYMKATDYSPMR